MDNGDKWLGNSAGKHSNGGGKPHARISRSVRNRVTEEDLRED